MASEWRKNTVADTDTCSYEYATLADLIELASGKEQAIIIVLDHITDVGNFGAIVRSAEVSGAIGIVVPKARSVQVNEAVYRTSAGAIEYLKVARESNIVDCLQRLKKAGFWVAGATEHARQDIWSSALEGRIALVLGSEETGLARLTRNTCDFEFKLPQFGKTQSLNVAQACTAILYEYLRRIYA